MRVNFLIFAMCNAKRNWLLAPRQTRYDGVKKSKAEALAVRYYYDSSSHFQQRIGFFQPGLETVARVAEVVPDCCFVFSVYYVFYLFLLRVYSRCVYHRRDAK